MPEPEKISRIVEDVLSASRTKKMRWVETADTSEFVSVMPGGKLSVKAIASSGVDYRDEPDNRPGLTINRRSDDLELIRITSAAPGVSQDELSEIYELARTSALGIEELVDEILSGLEDLR